MTGGQDPQLQPAARVAANEFISATTGKLIDEGRQTDTVGPQTHSCATNQLAEQMTDARQDVSDLEFKRLAHIYDTDAETAVHRSQRSQFIFEQQNDVSLRHWFSLAQTGSKNVCYS